jgi:acetylornithine deacetylase/succinyl-diaminopimelate desuccinylase-like protein
MVSLENALELARQGREQAERELIEDLRIPSVSTLPEHRADVRRNCDWLAARLARLGFETSIADMVEGGHPVLRADWRGAGEAPTLTIYGHYDVQPPDPLAEWRTPPFEPAVENGYVYARGAADNKGNHMAALKAVEYALAAGLALNLRFLIEGEEEIAGHSLPEYLKKQSGRLASDYTLIWDGGFEAEGQPAITTGLRGLVYMELEARGPGRDLHSGVFGGVAPNACSTLAWVLSELKGRDGVIRIPGFYDQVRAPSPDESADWDRSNEFGEVLRTMMSARALEGDADFPPVERIWARPTLDVNGFVGGFTGEGSKTVIPARAMAKVSMRLVPDQDPNRIRDAFVSYVKGLSSPGVELMARELSSAPPVLLDWRNPAAVALRDAFAAGFGRPAAYVRTGGTISVTIDFQQEVGGQILCSGIIQPNAGAHGPNERLSLDHYHRGTETLLHFFYRLAAP